MVISDFCLILIYCRFLLAKLQLNFVFEESESEEMIKLLN
jgi:hypothetical protein